MKTILALIDFSDVTPRILDHAQAMSKAFRSEVVLIHVVPPEPLVVDFAPPAVPPDLFQSRQKELFDMRDSLTAHGIPASAQVLGGLLEETLLKQINLLDPDIILMGSHGHGALYHLIVGSVTGGIIKHAARPVLVIPSLPVPEPPVTEPVWQNREEKADAMTGALAGIPLQL